MSERRLRILSLQDLKVIPSYDDGGLTLAFQGTADMRHAGALQAFLQSVHLEAQSMRVKDLLVVADMRELEFMASSCFKGFVQWLSRVNEERRYKIKFMTSMRHGWQRTSLKALSCFAPAYTVIERA